MPGPLVYYRVPSLNYPRNRRIREYLSEAEVAMDVIEANQFAPRRLVALVGEVWRLWKASRAAAAIILAERQIRYAAPAIVVARLRRRPLVVDAFIGLEETMRDKSSGRASKAMLRVARAFDALALRHADAVLIDTECRADDLVRSHHLDPDRVMSLPVGAPRWTQDVASPTGSADDILRILYYGNYIPLHGTTYVVEALALTERPFDALFIGGGQDRAAVEDRVRELGLTERIRFLDAVPESALRDHLSWSHVVIGIFGASRKAETVIANKVWQGLGASRVVITRDSPALAEIAPLVGSALRVVPAADPAAIAAELDAISGDVGADGLTGARLEKYVIDRFDVGFARVGEAIERPRGRRRMRG
jgi:glycosyltransferase involved in cell wall biosynthesis